MKTYSEKLKNPLWQKKRLEILNRDNFQCQFCSDKESTLNVHHLAYGKEPWLIDNKCLITLCETCHKQEEIDIKEAEVHLIKSLKKSGFSSISMNILAVMFEKTDKNWSVNEPAFSTLEFLINDEELFEAVSILFWKRVNKKIENDMKKEVENG